MHTSTNEFIRKNSDAFIRMHSYEPSDYTYANGNIMTVKDIFCLQYFSFVLACVNTAFLLLWVCMNAPEFIRMNKCAL